MLMYDSSLHSIGKAAKKSFFFFTLKSVLTHNKYFVKNFKVQKATLI